MMCALAQSRSSGVLVKVFVFVWSPSPLFKSAQSSGSQNGARTEAEVTQSAKGLVSHSRGERGPKLKTVIMDFDIE